MYNLNVKLIKTFFFFNFKFLKFILEVFLKEKIIDGIIFYVFTCCWSKKNCFFLTRL